MVKTAQDGDLNAHVSSISKLVACHQHQREFVLCHKMFLPDLQSLSPRRNVSDAIPNSTILLDKNTFSVLDIIFILIFIAQKHL